MSLLARYPRNQWSEELRRVVDAQQRRMDGFWPELYGRILDRAQEEEDTRNPPWDVVHYQDWERHEIVWRVVFLQGAGRRMFLELRLWWYLFTPLLVLSALMAGVLIGVISRG